MGVQTSRDGGLVLRTHQASRTDRLVAVCAHRGVAAAAARWRHRGSGSARAGSVAVIAAGAAWGVAAHFLRDVATAPIALWWPVSSAGILVPGYWYLAALLVLATL